jgi:hypothetical protein
MRAGMWVTVIGTALLALVSLASIVLTLLDVDFITFRWYVLPITLVLLGLMLRVYALERSRK